MILTEQTALAESRVSLQCCNCQMFSFLITCTTFNHLQLVSGPRFLISLQAINTNHNNQSIPLLSYTRFPTYFPNVWIIGPTMAFSSPRNFFQVTIYTSFSCCLVPGTTSTLSIFFAYCTVSSQLEFYCLFSWPTLSTISVSLDPLKSGC